MVRATCDIAQSLNVLGCPRGAEQTQAAIERFLSNKEYVEIARTLKEEDAAKLVDVIDQVRCIDSGRLHPHDEVSVIRQLDLLAGKRPEIWHCSGH